MKYSYQSKDFISITSISEIDNVEQNNLVYLGRKTCPNCRQFVSKLSEVSKKEKIYYIDTDKQKNDTQFIKFIKREKINVVPILIRIKNNKVIKVYSYPNLNKNKIKNILKGEI